MAGRVNESMSSKQREGSLIVSFKKDKTGGSRRHEQTGQGAAWRASRLQKGKFGSKTGQPQRSPQGRKKTGTNRPHSCHRDWGVPPQLLSSYFCSDHHSPTPPPPLGMQRVKWPLPLLREPRAQLFCPLLTQCPRQSLLGGPGRPHPQHRMSAAA